MSMTTKISLLLLLFALILAVCCGNSLLFDKFSFGELSVIDWDFDFDFEGWGEWEKFQLVWN